jgi:hypothetical protein
LFHRHMPALLRQVHIGSYGGGLQAVFTLVWSCALQPMLHLQYAGKPPG